MDGGAWIRDMRITVALVFNLVANGMTTNCAALRGQSREGLQ